MLDTVSMLILIALAAFVATLTGGLFALHLKDRLHLILGFSAGAIIGVAFFDLLPEALSLGGGVYSISTLTSCIALGFIGYLILDRFATFHSHADDGHTHGHRGTFGAGSLSLHSFLDGVAIGLSFQVSPVVGAIVATAVLVHDFSDGINTVNLIMRDTADKKVAWRWLIIDALAPVLGIVATLFFSLRESSLGIILSLFCGFFLYIGASDLLPESHHNHPRVLTTVMTLAGIGTMYIAIRLAGL